MPRTPTKPGDKAAEHKTAGHAKADDKSHSGTQHKSTESAKPSASATKK